MACLTSMMHSRERYNGLPGGDTSGRLRPSSGHGETSWVLFLDENWLLSVCRTLMISTQIESNVRTEEISAEEVILHAQISYLSYGVEITVRCQHNIGS